MVEDATELLSLSCPNETNFTFLPCVSSYLNITRGAHPIIYTPQGGSLPVRSKDVVLLRHLGIH